jgi:hypothetical protein
MSATSLLSNVAQAARPVAGGSPLLVVWQTTNSGPSAVQVSSAKLAECWLGLNLPRACWSATSHNGRAFSRCGLTLRSRGTSTGLARAATQVIVTPRGPSRFRPLTSNVRRHMKNDTEPTIFIAPKPDSLEITLRLVCGACLGLFFGFSAWLRLAPIGAVWTATLVVAFVLPCAWGALKYGDHFWHGLSGWLRGFLFWL